VYYEVMKARIYVDASVVGGCEDDEFAAHSLRLMESFVRGDFVLVVSTLTVQEMEGQGFRFETVRRFFAPKIPRTHGWITVGTAMKA
jgi:hypothetical protein